MKEVLALLKQVQIVIRMEVENLHDRVQQLTVLSRDIADQADAIAAPP